MSPPLITPLGDEALRIVLGDTLDPAINQRVCALAERINTAALDGVTDVLPAFASVGVYYRAPAVQRAVGETPFAALSRQLQPLLPDTAMAAQAAPRTVDIPVCYGGEHGPDLAEAAAGCGLTVEELLSLHQQPQEAQQVYMIGFAPGHPYIGQLDARVALPRRATPRTLVPAGSVAIANRQTVIYSLAAPGGWSLIGRTPLALFDGRRAEPCLLRPGDRVRFVPIDAAAFAAWPAAGTEAA